MNTECPKCGQRYEIDNSMAGQKVECECGEQWQVKDMPILLSKQNREQEKSRLTFILLGLFLGFLGAHNVYIGRPLKGVMQLILIPACLIAINATPYPMVAILSIAILVILFLSILAEICMVTKDAKGVLLK